MADDVTVLGDAIEKVINGGGAGLDRRTRTLKSGATKTRFTISVKSDKLLMNTSERAISAPVAQAIVKHLRERIEGISAAAAPATIKAREVAKKALDAGKAWATKRYAGGRTGSLEPDTSDRQFNDSTRFAKTLVGMWNDSEGSWTINTAANRLSPDTLDGRGARGGDSALAFIWARLVSFVPELENVDSLLDVLPVRAALDKAHEQLMTKVTGATFELALERVRAAIDLFSQVDELLAG
jgi:hypothetical protein